MRNEEDTHMFLKANAEGEVYVMAPTKYAKNARLMPLARMVVGKISAHQMKDGASTNW